MGVEKTIVKQFPWGIATLTPKNWAQSRASAAKIRGCDGVF